MKSRRDILKLFSAAFIAPMAALNGIEVSLDSIKIQAQGTAEILNVLISMRSFVRDESKFDTVKMKSALEKNKLLRKHKVRFLSYKFYHNGLEDGWHNSLLRFKVGRLFSSKKEIKSFPEHVGSIVDDIFVENKYFYNMN